MSFDSDDDDAFLTLGEQVVTPVKKRKWMSLQNDEEEDTFGFEDHLDATFDAYCTAQESTRDTVLRCRVLGMEAVPSSSLKVRVTLLAPHGSSKESTGEERDVVLKDAWRFTPLAKGDTIHVILTGEAPDATAQEIVVSNRTNLLILHPDVLVSSTSVADGLSCARRAVLSDRIRNPYDKSGPLLYGSLLHEVFQSCLRANNFTDAFLDATIASLVAQVLEDVHTIGDDEHSAADSLRASSRPAFPQFERLYMIESGSDMAPIVDLASNQHHEKLAPLRRLLVEEVVDIEETVWLPHYGLKGKIDVTARATMTDQHGATTTQIVPLELKTGKDNDSVLHRAQTMLYTLMLQDRNGTARQNGFLYYCQSGRMMRLAPASTEVASLLMLRNEIAHHLRSRTTLPPMITNAHICSYCPQRDACMLYDERDQAVTPRRRVETMQTLVEDAIGAVQPAHAAFLHQWERLLSIEEDDMHATRREMWIEPIEDREKAGKCIGHLRPIKTAEAEEDVEDVKCGAHLCHLVTFQRSEGKTSFLQSQFAPGDLCAISFQDGSRFGYAMGLIASIEATAIKVYSDRPFNEKHSVVYRLDKDDLTSGMGFVRHILFRLVTMDKPLYMRRREDIIDLKSPTWQKEVPVALQAPSDGMTLNACQQRAVDRVLTADRYTLILGMPGTGKTTTIVEILHRMVKAGKSVLLTSYTHSAVDNVLLKYLEQWPVEEHTVLRLGTSAHRVHPKIRPYLPTYTSVAEVQQKWSLAQIVATTCLGVSHPIFAERTFDLCIVDEASQLMLPTSIAPLLCATTFVLVGDHHQLPPLVRQEEARKGGLDVSLFRYLSEKHPNAMVCLDEQYRMNGDIMALSNALIYDHTLTCGSEAVRDAKLTMSPCDVHDLLSWQRTLIVPEHRVLFFDTDLMIAREEKVGESIQNATEAALLSSAVDILCDLGIEEDRIGVIAPYRGQLRLIQKHLAMRKEVEVYTIDRYQGRDKDVIFLSFVRSNEQGTIGDLLKDRRRLNVALTRAKKKLVLFGSQKTLRKGQPDLYNALFDLMREKEGWIVPLSADALAARVEKENAVPHVSTQKRHSPIKAEPIAEVPVLQSSQKQNTQ